MSVAATEGLDGTPTASDVHAAEITTLGRGGSDTTAVALAARLDADRCQIYTDVRGIYTADPRIERDARQLDVIGYEEMMELAHQGAQVMQTRAVELGWVNGVVIEVLSSFEDAPGTQIREDPLVEQRNKVRGLAHDRNVAKITLVEVPGPAGRRPERVRAARRGRHQRRHDRPERRPRRRDGPVVHDPAGRARQGEAAARAAHPRPRLPRHDDRQLGGEGLDRRRRASRTRPGYAARMFGTLADAGINIEMISTSEIRITTIIAEDRVEEAVRALHAAFELEQPETVEAAGAAAG